MEHRRLNLTAACPPLAWLLTVWPCMSPIFEYSWRSRLVQWHGRWCRPKAVKILHVVWWALFAAGLILMRQT